MSLAAIERKIAELTAQMAKAAEAEDFEKAAALRNEIEALTGGGLIRKPPPGEMGLGTNIPVAAPPKNWRRPKKPDPMTANFKPRGKR
ncbi:MAG TPA: UvrB/UvrC motif-containing protein [Devosia sp.]